MIVLTFDIGSTNIKLVALNIDKIGKDENITVLCKVRKNTTDFAHFFYEILDTYSINKDYIEKIVVTGTGASFLYDQFDGIDIIKVDEFTSIAYGGILLSNLNDALIVSIGTGTTILQSNLYETKRLGGTGLGGGTFVGLSNALLQKKFNNNTVNKFDELINMASVGNRLNVDLTIGDISKNNIADMNKDITAANFAKMNTEFTNNDLVNGVLNLILENIALLVKSYNINNLPVVYIGTFVTSDIVRKRIIEIANYTGDSVRFIDNADFAIAIGAWEYYLLKLRNNIA